MNRGMNPMSLTSSNTSWMSSDGVPNQFPAGLRVVVVDDDPTYLRVLERMLKNCHYEVTKCSRAEDALKLLRDNKDCYDIVISEIHLPDMDGFKLLEHVGLEMDVPVIMMSTDDSKDVVMKGVTHGACDYLIKPVRMKALRNIWQHVFRKRMNEYKDFENIGSVEDGEGQKKPHVVWSVELHQQFVSAVNQLGIDRVGPKKILELMNVPGLTRENIASHLQKYRQCLIRLQHHQNGLGNSFMGPQDQPVLFQANPGALQYGLNDIHARPYTSLYQPPAVVAFPRELSGITSPLLFPMATFDSKGMVQEEVNSEMKGTDDWSLSKCVVSFVQYLSHFCISSERV